MKNKLIYCVDYDEASRQLVDECLKKYYNKVVTFCNGRDVLDVIKTEVEPISVIEDEIKKERLKQELIDSIEAERLDDLINN